MRYRVALPLGIVFLALLVGVAIFQTGGRAPALEARASRPQGVMGTSCRLVAIAPRGQGDLAERALERAEAELRRVEALMSTWIEASELSVANDAPVGPLTLSRDTRAVLESARRHHEMTEGAFDITCAPVIDLWRAAAERGSPPDEKALAEARAASSWELVDLGDEGVSKLGAGVRFDVSGNAKGYGIDRALDALRDAGAVGGLVDVGGDIRVFGRPPLSERWMVELRNPRGEGVLGEVPVDEGAVCTSGDYARPLVIGGQSYSHIVDPRTSRPVSTTPSVTVLAPTTIEADSWATALSVLGPQGLSKLPVGHEALILVEEGEALKAHATRGFPLDAEDLGLSLEVHR